MAPLLCCWLCHGCLCFWLLWLCWLWLSVLAVALCSASPSGYAMGSPLARQFCDGSGLDKRPRGPWLLKMEGLLHCPSQEREVLDKTDMGRPSGLIKRPRSLGCGQHGHWIKRPLEAIKWSTGDKMVYELL